MVAPQRRRHLCVTHICQGKGLGECCLSPWVQRAEGPGANTDAQTHRRIAWLTPGSQGGWETGLQPGGLITPRPHAQEKSSGGHFSRIPQSWSLGHPRASAVIDHLGAPHTSWTHVASGVPQAWPWCQGGPCPALWSATVAMDARGYQPERGLRAEGLCRF